MIRRGDGALGVGNSGLASVVTLSVGVTMDLEDLGLGESRWHQKCMGLACHRFAFEPLKESAHLFGLYYEVIVVLSDAECSLTGCVGVQEPVFLVFGGFVEGSEKVNFGVFVFVAWEEVIAMYG